MHMLRTCHLLLTSIVLCVPLLPAAAVGQDTTRNPPTDDQNRALRLYLDCSACDREFILSEIMYVHYVRDRLDAQVHLLITREETGGGGREYTLTFQGLGDFNGRRDTLRFAVPVGESQENIRREMVRVLKIGLMPFVARMPQAQRINITYAAEQDASPVADPWDSWVFKSSLRSYFNGEESRSYLNAYGDVSASRVTPDLKLRIAGWASYTEDVFDLEGSTLNSFSRGMGAETYAVVSLSDHWSWGGQSQVSTSVYANRKLATQIGPGIEFNVFPYSQSSRRQLRIAAILTHNYVRYYEETIYDRVQEHLFRGQVSVAFEVIEPWGSVELRGEDSRYLHDFTKNRLELSLETSLRLVAGLSVDVEISYSRVHDQLGLPKSGVSPDEILLRRRQLATQYEYWGSVGLSYSFGSIFNNVVNRRFGI